MGTFTPRLILFKPGDGGAGEGGDDIVDVTLDIANPYDTIDATAGLFHCTSATRPTTFLFPGRLIIETDTGKIYRHNGSTWKYIMHDPTGQYGNPFDIQTVAPPAGAAGTVTAGRSAAMVVLRLINCSFTTISNANVGRTLATTPVGWRPAYQITAAAALGNNVVSFVTWDTTGVITWTPFAAVPASTTFQASIATFGDSNYT